MAKAKQTATENNTADSAAPGQKKAAAAAVKVLTVKSVYGKILMRDFGVKEDGSPDFSERKLCRIAGYARSIESGSSDFGPWDRVVGDFAGTNYETGEMFIGKKAIIPGAMGEMIVSHLRMLLEEDATSSMKFSVDISAVVSARDENKYEYVIRPVIDSEISNPAVALLGME